MWIVKWRPSCKNKQNWSVFAGRFAFWQTAAAAAVLNEDGVTHVAVKDLICGKFSCSARSSPEGGDATWHASAAPPRSPKKQNQNWTKQANVSAEIFVLTFYFRMFRHTVCFYQEAEHQWGDPVEWIENDAILKDVLTTLTADESLDDNSIFSSATLCTTHWCKTDLTLPLLMLQQQSSRQDESSRL